jgi:heme/copper-type cytochrome/quinol oxidase subunit 3
MTSISSPAFVDVSRLPGFALDTRSPAWWGNTLLTVIETMTVVVLLAAYFYLWQANSSWPPANGEHMPPLLRPLPMLSIASGNCALMVVSLIPMVWLDRSARRYRRGAALWGCSLLTVIGVVTIVTRCLEFPGILFRWDDNAYASTVWAMLVLHLTYLVLATCETGILVVWMLIYGLDQKRVLDITLTAVYWYWTVGVGVVFYFVIYWLPRMI